LFESKGLKESLFADYVVYFGSGADLLLNYGVFENRYGLVEKACLELGESVERVFRVIDEVFELGVFIFYRYQICCGRATCFEINNKVST